MGLTNGVYSPRGARPGSSFSCQTRRGLGACTPPEPSSARYADAGPLPSLVDGGSHRPGTNPPITCEDLLQDIRQHDKIAGRFYGLAKLCQIDPSRCIPGGAQRFESAGDLHCDLRAQSLAECERSLCPDCGERDGDSVCGSPLLG